MTLLEEVLEILRRVVDDDVDLAGDTPLFSSGLLDSHALEEIHVAVEQRWAPIPPMELTRANFDTATAIAATVARLEPGGDHR